MSTFKQVNFRAICFALCAFFPAIPLVADSMPKKIFPTASAPEEFDLQVENLLRATNAIGDGFGGPYDRELEDRTRRDDRNWERALSKIIRNPGKYGFPLGESAISVAKLRGSVHNDEIVAASEMYFGEVVKNALTKQHEFEARGEKVPHWVSGGVHSILSELLDFDDPRILHMVLRHLVTNEGAELRMHDKFVVKRIPDALRASGNATHRDEAEVLVKRLREVGHDEIANDIERWEQRTGSSSRPANGESKERLPPLGRNSVSLENDGKPHVIPWSALFLTGSLILIASGFLVWRRSSTRH